MHVQTQQDLYLATEICVAEKDGRECPWYAVYSRVLWDYIFWDGGGGQHLYTILPQYSLVATFDTGHSTETNRLAGGITAKTRLLLRRICPISPIINYFLVLPNMMSGFGHPPLQRTLLSPISRALRVIMDLKVSLAPIAL